MVKVVGGGVVPILPNGAGGPTDAGTVDQRPEGGHLNGGVDRGDDVFGVGHIGRNEEATDLLCQRRPFVFLEVGHHDANSPRGQQPRGGLPQAGGPTGDDCGRPT